LVPVATRTTDLGDGAVEQARYHVPNGREIAARHLVEVLDDARKIVRRDRSVTCVQPMTMRGG